MSVSPFAKSVHACMHVRESIPRVVHVRDYNECPCVSVHVRESIPRCVRVREQHISPRVHLHEVFMYVRACPNMFVHVRACLFASPFQ